MSQRKLDDISDVADPNTLVRLFSKFERARDERDSAANRMSDFAYAVRRMTELLSEAQRLHFQLRFCQLKRGAQTAKSSDDYDGSQRIEDHD